MVTNADDVRAVLKTLANGTQKGNKLVNSEAEMVALYKTLGQNGTSIETTGDAAGVLLKRLADGTELAFRPFSKTNGKATIEIWYPGTTRIRKVHVR